MSIASWFRAGPRGMGARSGLETYVPAPAKVITQSLPRERSSEVGVCSRLQAPEQDCLS